MATNEMVALGTHTFAVAKGTGKDKREIGTFTVALNMTTETRDKHAIANCIIDAQGVVRRMADKGKSAKDIQKALDEKSWETRQRLTPVDRVKRTVDDMSADDINATIKALQAKLKERKAA